jgi:hypothetical protein
VISGVIVHIENQLPVMVDLEELPGPTDLVLRCTNVRGVDGKRPQYVHDRNSTFIFPMAQIRLIEAPAQSHITALAPDDTAEAFSEPADADLDTFDDEAEEDFLARIRDA